jgi:protein disulfide-isomerase A1
VKSDTVVVLANFASKDDEKYKEFEKVATEHRVEFLFGATFNKEDAESITLHKEFDEGKDVFSGEFKKEDISRFIKTHATPHLGEISPDNYMQYIEHGLPIGYFFVENDEQRNSIREKVTKVAKEFKGKINFVFIDAVKFGAHANSMNLQEGKWPAFAIHKDATDEKYPYEQSKEIAGDDVSKFCNDVVSGTIKPSLRSQKPPEDNNGPVKVVVGDTFNEIVKDESKDVFIEFYAPCKIHILSSISKMLSIL